MGSEMSQYHVRKVNKPIDGRVRVPGSKSITNRALLISALSDIRTKLQGVLFSDDTVVFTQALKDLGFPVEVNEDPDPDKCAITLWGDESIKSVRDNRFHEGQDGAKTDKNEMTGTDHIPVKKGRVYVGSAGTAARFITAMLALSEGAYEIQASPQMKKRPMKPLFDALASLGAGFEYMEEEGHLPVKVTGCFAGPEKEKEFPGEVFIDADQSTQFLSALLMLSPLIAERTEKPFKIFVEGSRGKGSYVLMTLRVMEQFGVNVSEVPGNSGGKISFVTEPGQHYRLMSADEKPEDSLCKNDRSDSAVYDVEPDVSAAGYFFAAAAVTGGRVLLEEVHRYSMQGDIRLLDILEKMGCEVQDTPEGIVLIGAGTGKLTGIDADMRDFSDQTMTLAAIAPFCSSEVNIRNVAHIRKQESDRIHGMVTELKKMGVEAQEREDGLLIRPAGPEGIKPVTVHTYDDHRMAMAFAVTGLAADGIVIDNPECCSKTFKDYFSVLEGLTG